MDNPFSASSSLQFGKNDDISPLTPRPSNDPFSTTRAHNSASANRHGSLSSIMEVISPLETSLPSWNESCWSDAATAGAVLSLLHKEPLRLPPNRTLERGDTQNRQRLLCAVCLEALETDQYPEPQIAAGCDHSSIPGTHICIICLSRSLDIQFSSSRTTLLTCPLCHERLSDEEVRKWASKPTFQAYDNARAWQILEEDAEFVTCIRPDCRYGQLHAGGLGDPVVVCGSCGTRTCFIHRGSLWHEGSTCAEYDAMEEDTNTVRTTNEFWRLGLPAVLRIGVQRNTEEFLSEKTIQETTRPCPDCLVATEKAGGCKYMRCGMCWREWCWDCGSYWERGHLNVECSVFWRGPIRERDTASENDGLAAEYREFHPITNLNRRLQVMKVQTPALVGTGLQPGASTAPNGWFARQQGQSMALCIQHHCKKSHSRTPLVEDEMHSDFLKISPRTKKNVTANDGDSGPAEELRLTGKILRET